MAQEMKLSIGSLAELDRYRDAQNLIGLKMRTSLICSLTGVTAHHVKRVYKERWGELKQGQLPASVANFVSNVETSARLSGFVAFCIMRYRDLRDALSAQNIYSAHQDYSKLTGEALDINAAFYAVRDVASGLIQWRHCTSCESAHMTQLQSFPLRGCPFCKLARKDRRVAA